MPRGAARSAPELLAAVDLGSNSFHMVVARYAHGQLTVVDRLREMVRLASGLDTHDRLDREVAARAIGCLERMGQRLRGISPDGVRAVGTSALRRAHRKQAFFERARAALGHPIEVISGREEARLIYSGVAHTMPRVAGRRFVCDIGGGSTELIIGEALAPLELESLPMGCVGLGERYFADGKLSAKRIARARVAAGLELEPVRAGFSRRGWQSAVGSSGTVRAIGEALRELDPGAAAITPEGLDELAARLGTWRNVRDIGLRSVSEERRPVFPAGVAILGAVLDVLGIREMRVADGAMREGLLYDLVGRYSNEDARERTVRAMQRRYHVDTAQAERVERTALGFLAAVEKEWELDEGLDQPLGWAARLHEIGLDVSHNGYHRHGAYLLENADMPGFARGEQRLLASLVGGHRRKIEPANLDSLIPPWNRQALYLIVLLRLAALLHRGRTDEPLPELTLRAKGRSLEVRFPARWLRGHPLTVADLQREVAHLRAVDMRLRVFTGR